MRCHNLLTLWILLVGSSVSATAGAAVAKLSRTTTISFSQSVYGAPLVQVRLPIKGGGVVIGTFVIDAAADRSSISQALADRLGYPSAPVVQTGDQTEASALRPDRVVEIPSVTIGRFPFQPKLFILDGKVLASGYGMSVDGVLGGNLISVVPLLIDYSQQLVTLFAPGRLSPDDLKSVDMGDAISVPVEDAQGDFHYKCRVALVSGDVKAEEGLSVETAGVQTVISANTATSLNLKPNQSSRKQATIGGPVLLDQAPVSHVSLGAATTADAVTVAYPRTGFPPGTAPQLGLDVLARYRFLLDFGGKKMYLKPYPSPVPVPEL